MNHFLAISLLLISALADPPRLLYSVERTVHTAGNVQVLGCYTAEYTYYYSRACNGNVCQSTDVCLNQIDPRDFGGFEYEYYVKRLITITVPSVVGGLFILCLLCTCCCGYYCIT